MDNPETPPPTQGWSRIIGAIGSPLKLFALVVLVCNSVFGVAAAMMKDLDAFTYSLHLFLGVIAAFVLTALWSPRSLYHPKELLEIRHMQRDDDDRQIFPVARPWVPTLVISVGVLFYGAYQFTKVLMESDAEESVSIFDLFSKLF